MSIRPQSILSLLVWTFSLLSLVCCVPAQAQEDLWCFLVDDFSLEFDLENNLTLNHLAAMHNCCPDPVTWEMEQSPGLIAITEVIGEEEPCDCICCFDLSVQVTGLSPGLWTVQYHWFDFEGLAWLNREFQVIVPASSAEDVAELINGNISDCRELSFVPDPQYPIRSWGAVKSWYRSVR